MAGHDANTLNQILAERPLLPEVFITDLMKVDTNTKDRRIELTSLRVLSE